MLDRPCTTNMPGRLLCYIASNYMSFMSLLGFLFIKNGAHVYPPSPPSPYTNLIRLNEWIHTGVVIV